MNGKARGQGRWAVQVAAAWLGVLALTGCGVLAKKSADAEELLLDDDAVDPGLTDEDADAELEFDATGDAATQDAQDVDAADIKDIHDTADVKDIHDTAGATDAAAETALDADDSADDTDAADDAGAGMDAEPDVAIDTGPLVCTPEQVAACDDKIACTADTCDPVFGCNHVYTTDPCDDGSACTADDACLDGQCMGNSINCDDGKPCTADSCKPSFGCVHQNSSAPCEDGNICTVGEACKAGACIGGQGADCSDGIACTLDTCDPAVGCQHSSGDGPCDDGSYCTVGETCTGGVCAGGSPALCNDGNECTQDACDPPIGCTFTSAPGTCDDANPCTAKDTCADGVCTGQPLTCLAADACHTAGVCNGKTGACSSVNAPDGTACDDGIGCTTGDACVTGACVGVDQCDDLDSCTLDACDKTGACTHTAACTVGGTVTGLLSGGLTLQDGTHLAGVNQDGPFTLAGGYGNGAEYLVTVLAVPANPLQHCEVEQATGAIHGGNVTDVQVTCGHCGDGVVGADPVRALRWEWLANTQSPAPEFMDCTLNGQNVVHADAATEEWYCDVLPMRVTVTDPAALALVKPGQNAVQCQFAQNLAWIVLVVEHASGRTESLVVYDNPQDTGGLTDAIRRNSACPGYAAPGVVNAKLQVVLQETCDDGNLTGGDGCSAICLPEACTPGSDSDGDGLDNCVETGSGVYVDALHTGTSPQLWDTDGDGLGDGDELLGTPTGLDLAALGANPLRRDVFVEADWMVDAADCSLHSHQITAVAEAQAVEMFANAPVQNPDGTTGIALHIDYGQGGVWTGGDKAGTSVEFPPDIGPDFAAVKAAHFDAKRLGYFHYALMMHSLGPTAGGIGEVTGDDFIVASGGCELCFTCDGSKIPGHLAIEAFCHELGHNLGLQHGGDTACNGKANYPSIMNYRHAYFGVDKDCDDVPDGTLDYSRGDRIVLDEKTLDESQGVCGGFWIDWNKDGSVTPAVKKDLNGEFNNTCPGVFATLRDFADWERIVFCGVSSGVSAAAKGGRKAVCYDDAQSVAKRQRK